MIRKVTVKNFKLFADQTFELSDSIVLAGLNNSGKTTLLQAIATWKFGLERWLAQRKGTTTGVKRTGAQITRQQFSVLPLKEMNLMWTDRSPGNKIEICVEGENHQNGSKWTCDLEFEYASHEVIYVRPKDAKNLGIEEINAFPPDEAAELEVVYVPPLSGTKWNEPRLYEGMVNLLSAQGSTGEILKNLLLEVSMNDNHWRELRNHILDLFQIEVQKPIYVAADPYITCEYKIPNKRRSLDLSSLGSGTLQVLLLLSFLYSRSASVLLLDEPDARQHVILQDEVYRRLKKIAQHRSAQLIVATHSEVVLDSTEPQNVMAFIGESPRRLGSTTERKQLRQALKHLPTKDLLLAEEIGNVLYVEGESDGKILSEWSKILGEHSSSEFFRRPYVVPLEGRDISKARDHFFALKAAVPKMRGFCLLDGNNRDSIDEMRDGVRVISWPRYEIENYLLHRGAIERFVGYKRYWQKESGTILEEILRKEFEQGIQELGYLIPEEVLDFGELQPFTRVKASKDLFIPLLSGMGVNIAKKDLFLLAAVMEPEEIHPDVIAMLDRIADAFGLSG